VQAGASFDFKVAVLFSCKPAGPVTVTDTLPAGLQATSAPATWKATFANASTSTGGMIAELSGKSSLCKLACLFIPKMRPVPTFNPNDPVDMFGKRMPL
jgi:hypothetical protein